MSIARRISTASAAAVLAVAPLVAVTPEVAQAAALTCRAHMSDATPAQYSTTYVLVTTAPLAGVRTVAHYRTTTTAHRGRANRHGHASIAYRISDATPHYRVHVSVTVTKNGHVGHCGTSFVPHRR